MHTGYNSSNVQDPGTECPGLGLFPLRPLPGWGRFQSRTPRIRIHLGEIQRHPGYRPGAAPSRLFFVYFPFSSNFSIF